MRNKICSFLALFVMVLCIAACVHGRPNPVPNDEVDPDREAEKYEERHNKIQAHRVKRHRTTGPEDPDDQDVLEELKGLFEGIRRRNRDIHPHRESVFQKYIDEHMFSNDDESKEH